ncbi:MAG: hypothetical protein CMI16_01875 [Opitutaceae bacterium]|nr:hypothetical protein [Opitutaceae bacterium]|tara:strand:+ start:352 stop:1263 length:912 start_codon:yes stop_codon:yes gene_type:complete
MPNSVSTPQKLHVTGGRGRLAALIEDHFRAPQHTVEPYSRIAGDGFHALSQLETLQGVSPSDSILHLAWSTLPATSEQTPGIEQQQDIPWLRKMLAALTNLPATQRPHFIFFSSGGSVYGNAPDRPNSEDDTCQPIGNYGRAKQQAESLIERAIADHDLPCTVLRISNPYGYPVPTGRAQGIIPHAIRAATEGHTLKLWGDGHARKDFLYYTDFLSALEEIVAQRLIGTFNLASGESHSIREIITLVENQTRKKISIEQLPAPDWDVQDSRLHNDKLSQAIGWKPQVTLEEGIRRSAAGFLSP